MPFRAETTIEIVPFGLIVGLWPAAQKFLMAGLKAARTDTLGCILARLYSGEDHLWLITANGEVCGAFITTFKRNEKGVLFVGVSNLGGYGIDKWARRLAGAMINFANMNECDAVRFYGRRAWSRVLPDFKMIGRADAANVLYERAAS